MTREKAYQFIRRQFNQGNAWSDGIATIYLTQKQTSLALFKEALQLVNGEIWKENDWQEQWNVTKHFYRIECFIPAQHTPRLNL